MRIWNYKYFIPVVLILFFGLASYAVIGLILNSWALDRGSFHGNWPVNERSGIVVLMVVEALFLLVSLIGVCGAFLRNVVIWYIPGFILLGTGVTLVAFGAVSLREASKDFTLDIFQALQTVNGTRADESLSWISTVQWEHDCCGVISYKDYLQLKFPSLRTGDVPDTCCNRKSKIPELNCGQAILVPGKNIQEVERLLMTNGCGKIISHTQGQTLKKLGTEMLLVGLLALVFAVFLYFGIFKIVVAEYAETEHGDEIGNDDTEACLSQTSVSNTTAANTSANSHLTVGTPRNAINRRIFRTRRHGGGESIVSFAVDLENNNVESSGSSAASHGRQISIGGNPLGRTKGRARTMARMAARPMKNKGELRPSQGGRGNTQTSTGLFNFSKEKLEMLMKPRDNNSILSTTPYPSSTHNFISYFRQNQEETSKFLDSDSNPQRPSAQPQLSHYSSLPHVQTPVFSVSKVDAKSKIMAELKQRFPSRGTSVQPSGRNTSPPLAPIPPVSSKTQHHHYYRIPIKVPTSSTAPAESATASTVLPPVFLDRKFPGRLVESTLPTIQEEGESAPSTLVKPPAEEQRVSIFDVFSEINSQPGAVDCVDACRTDRELDPEHDLASRTDVSSLEMVSTLEPSSVIIIKEDTDGLDESTMMELDCPNGKVEMESIDAMVYFQI